MTAYNRERYLPEAIESVLQSSFTDFELLIVDDCSTDQTLAIAKKYATTDRRIKVVSNSQNLGDYPNRNHAADHATGKYLLYVDSDDTLNVDAMDYILRQFKVHPDAKFATIYQQADISEPVMLIPEISIRKHFFAEHFLDNGPGGSIIEREYFNSIGKFPTRFGSANDMYFNIKAAANSPTILLPYVYLYYRRHEDQEIADSYPYLYNNHLYMNAALELPELPISVKERTGLLLKNKRRFIVHSLVYLKNSRNLRHFYQAYQKAGFGLGDFLKAVFH